MSYISSVGRIQSTPVHQPQSQPKVKAQDQAQVQAQAQAQVQAQPQPKVVQPSQSQPSRSQQSQFSAANAEASETLSTTRQEAAKGDQIAIRKLARLSAAQQGRKAAPAHAHEVAAESEASSKASVTAKTSNGAGRGLDTVG